MQKITDPFVANERTTRDFANRKFSTWGHIAVLEEAPSWKTQKDWEKVKDNPDGQRALVEQWRIEAETAPFVQKCRRITQDGGKIFRIQIVTEGTTPTLEALFQYFKAVSIPIGGETFRCFYEKDLKQRGIEVPKGKDLALFGEPPGGNLYVETVYGGPIETNYVSERTFFSTDNTDDAEALKKANNLFASYYALVERGLGYSVDEMLTKEHCRRGSSVNVELNRL